MTAHRLPSDLGLAVASSFRIQNPGTGGTVNLRGIHLGICRGFGPGTFKLPNLSSEKQIGTVVMVVADGAQTWQNAAGVTILSLASGQAQLFQATTTSAWSPVGGTIIDSGGFFEATDVETALQSLGRNAQIVRIPLTSFVDADGDPLAKFADNASPNPGFNLANSEAFGIRWNDNATQNQPVLTNILLPELVATTITLHVLASKTGATVGDAVTFTVTAFKQATGSLHDSGSDIGGVTSAMVGTATAKQCQAVTLDITLTETGRPHALTLTLTPTSGTLGTDDVIVEAVWLSYQGTN